MSAALRHVTAVALARWVGQSKMRPGQFLNSLSVLIDIAAADRHLGDAWQERSELLIQDLRDWLARLEEGDDA